MDDLSVWPSQVWAHLCVFTEYSPAEGALYYDSFMCKTKRALISPHQRRCRKCHDAFTCLSQTEPMFLFCKGGRNVALWHCKESFLYIAPRVIWRSQAHSLSRAFKEGPMAPWVYSVHYKYFNFLGPFGSLKASSLTAFGPTLNMGFDKRKPHLKEQQSLHPLPVLRRSHQNLTPPSDMSTSSTPSSCFNTLHLSDDLAQFCWAR